MHCQIWLIYHLKSWRLPTFKFIKGWVCTVQWQKLSWKWETDVLLYQPFLDWDRFGLTERSWRQKDLIFDIVETDILLFETWYSNSSLFSVILKQTKSGNMFTKLIYKPWETPVLPNHHYIRFFIAKFLLFNKWRLILWSNNFFVWSHYLS